MHIRALRLHHFRNLEDASIDFHPKLNIFCGLNGQGKTNLVEAINIAATLKTFKSGIQNADLIMWGQQAAFIKADFEEDGPLPVEVSISAQGKKAKVSGKTIKDAAELGKSLATVTFVPDDLQLVQGSPQRRRKALDRFCFGINPRYAQIYRRYAHALAHRNQLLKDPHCNPQSLAAFDETLVITGIELIRMRHIASVNWASVFNSHLKALVGDAFTAHMKYHAQVFSDQDLNEAPEDWMRTFFLNKLQQKAAEERKRRTSLVGPHLDDILFDFSGRSARRLASQGQARAMVLAMKMAEVEVIQRKRQQPPLLLLDDVISELDAEKANNLLQHMEALTTQTFITTTELSPDLAKYNGQAFKLQNGNIVEQQSLPMALED
ncbi:MAG: hypothetical protein CMH56_11705 [Myxococcales bacterium]|nr:hypothetical protein [Myxococcales bacterium]